MQTFMSQAEISALSSGALQSPIRELESALRYERNPSARARLEAALRAARAEIARRQPRFAPKPPGFR